MEKNVNRIVNPYFGVINNSEEFKEFLSLYKNSVSINKFPFLINDEESVSTLEICLEILNEEVLHETLLEVKKIDLNKFFDKKSFYSSYQQLMKDAVALEQRRNSDEDEDYYSNEKEYFASWEEKVSSNVIYQTDNFIDSINFGVVPTSQSWQIPAFLLYGGWNECPSAYEHCAVLLYWQKKYGAEIFNVTDDIIECYVKAPPTNLDESLELAWEQTHYCGDIVSQGTETIEALALTLQNSSEWYFWWD
jgi:hypothetical protein